ncbi:MAG: hypothetical protein GY785_08460 [Gammaproteobacteria bacterium]|nr:hypothetical protein [Gammaproteobacteria bacterium]
MRSMITRTSLLFSLCLFSSVSLAATTDGLFGGVNEYSYNTEATPNDMHDTHGHGTPGSEYDDGSGGDRYDINYLGFDISGGQFQFGAVGGSILSTPHLGIDAGDIDKRPLYLGDIAINVTDHGADYQDPTQNGGMSNEWDYAVRILTMAADSFTFSVLTAADPQWLGLDIYGREAAGKDGHHTDTFRMENGEAIGGQVFTGKITADSDGSDGDDDYVLEGSFDLSLLSLFNEETGGRIITYLTMSCANDEAIVVGDVSPVPLPSAVWLFGSALIGFIGVSRRTRV